MARLATGSGCKPSVVFGLAWAFTVVLLMPANGLADESEDRFFQGLRDRRLFSLAEEYCSSEIATGKLSDERRVSLSLELSRTYVEHAQYVSGEEQTDLWKQAAGCVESLLAGKPLPDRELVLIQRALVFASQCAFRRIHCDLFVDDNAAREAGKKSGRDAIRQFRIVESDLEKNRFDTSTIEKRRLLRNVRLQLGLVGLDVAQLLPNDSPDRAEMLLNAQAWLRQLDERPSQDIAGLQARIGMAVCVRLQGDPRAARREISALMADAPTEVDILDQMAAEHVRLLLLEDKAEDAGQFFVSHRKKHKRLSGELHFLKVETLMQIRRIPAEHKSQKLTQQIDNQLESAIKRVDMEVGGYWSARCRVLVDRLSESNTLGVEVANMMQSARSQYLAGHLRESAKGYLDAAQLAERSGKNGPAADFRFTAASILLKSKEYTDSTTAFQLFLTKHASDDRAANASLLKAWGLGQLYNADPSTERREAYAAALNQHRKGYPGTDGVGDSNWMLGQLEEQQRDVVSALELYRQVPHDHRYGPSARLGVARLYELIFERLTLENASSSQVGKWQQRATEDLERISKRFRATQQLEYGKAEFLLRMARVFLKFPTPDYARVDEYLETVTSEMEAQRPADNEVENGKRVSLLAEARRARIVSLAGRKQTAAAGVLLNQLATQDSEQFLDVVDGLSKLAEQRNDLMAFELGLLQIKALDLLESRLSDSKSVAKVDRRRLTLMRVQALMTTAGHVDAIALLKSLLKQTPKDQKLLAQLANAYEATNRKESTQQATTVWKRIESMNKPGSVGWCNARYHVARLGLEQGQVAETRKLLRVTRLLYPELGNAELKARFMELEKTIDNSKVGSP